MRNIIHGKVWKFGDNIDTDVIAPTAYSKLSIDEMKVHVMDRIRPEFARDMKPGDIVVAGINFGCGSSREQAPLALKYAGAKCVLAESFARIFFRNAINIGLPVIECRGISAAVETGDELAVDFEAGKIENVSKGKKFQVDKLPPFIIEILVDGVLIENLLRRINKK